MSTWLLRSQDARREPDFPARARSILTGAVTRRLIPLAVIAGWLVSFALLWPPDGLGTDFYPIYRAAQAVLHHEDPYGAAVTAELIRTWHAPFAAAGYAYPLPAAVAAVPLALLPLPLAAGLWAAFGAGASLAAVTLRPGWREHAWLPFCFMPLHLALLYKQPTLIWFGLVVLLLTGMRRGWPALVGICVALLPAKPQVGLLFAGAGLVWAWRHNRTALAWAGGSALVLWGGSFLLQPGWIAAWLTSVARYNAMVRPANPLPLLPMAVLLFVFCRRLPWWAQLAVVQTMIFPITDVYGTLPLLLVWVALGGPLALIGAGVSWLGWLGGWPGSPAVLVGAVLLPLLVFSGWRFAPAAREWVARREGPA